MKEPVVVVCALILRGERVLIAQRPEGKHLALKWEFPGGKVEPGEQPAAALVREIREELGCEIEVLDPLPASLHVYDRGQIRLLPFLCALAADSPEPFPHEHLTIAWVSRSEISGYDLAAADLPIVADWIASCGSKKSQGQPL
jgi:8-oxo-dGTP diphosphatase